MPRGMLLRSPQILAALLRRQALAREGLDVTAQAPRAESTAPSPPIDFPADDPAASVIQRIRDAATAAIEKINSDEVSIAVVAVYHVALIKVSLVCILRVAMMGCVPTF